MAGTEEGRREGRGRIYHRYKWIKQYGGGEGEGEPGRELCSKGCKLVNTITIL